MHCLTCPALHWPPQTPSWLGPWQPAAALCQHALLWRWPTAAAAHMPPCNIHSPISISWANTQIPTQAAAFLLAAALAAPTEWDSVEKDTAAACAHATVTAVHCIWTSTQHCTVQGLGQTMRAAGIPTPLHSPCHSPLLCQALLLSSLLLPPRHLGPAVIFGPCMRPQHTGTHHHTHVIPSAGNCLGLQLACLLQRVSCKSMAAIADCNPGAAFGASVAATWQCPALKTITASSGPEHQQQQQLLTETCSPSVTPPVYSRSRSGSANLESSSSLDGLGATGPPAAPASAVPFASAPLLLPADCAGDCLALFCGGAAWASASRLWHASSAAVAASASALRAATAFRACASSCSARARPDCCSPDCPCSTTPASTHNHSC